MKEKAIILLGRFPTPGKVKTRLAKEIGAKKAAEFYKHQMEYLFSELESLKDTVDSYFYFADESETEDIEKWVSGRFKIVKPVSTDIEENLSHAFKELLRNYTKVISIASDVPDINRELIQTAFESLDVYDVVIGPDDGGGIYLFGCKQHFVDLYRSEKRSGDKIYADTIKWLKNVKVLSLPVLTDVDTKADLDKLQTRE